MEYEYRTKEEVIKYIETHGFNKKESVIQRSKMRILSFISRISREKDSDCVIIYGSSFEYFWRTLAKQYCVITLGRAGGISLSEYCLNKRYSLLYYRNDLTDAANAYLDDDEKKMEVIKAKYIHYFKRIKPKLLLTVSIFRTADMIVYDAARECNIPVILMMHGFITRALIGDAQMKEDLFAKKFIDFYWFWSEKDRERYIDMQLCGDDNSFVIGYPREKKEKFLPERLSVLFVGEAMEDDVEASIKFHKMANGIYMICNRMGIPFKYKSHKQENKEHIKEYLSSDICFVNNLFEEFRENQVVVGGRTSALMEAGLMGNYVIQIVYDHERVDKYIFEHCYVIEDYKNEFEPLMTAIKNKNVLPKELSPYEFYQPEDLLAQFNKGVEMLERK